MLQELWTSVIAIVAGFAMLVWGADRFVHGAAALAKNLGVPIMVVGLVVVGFGTSAPEILVSIMAAFDGNPGLAVGNAIGSNIANIGMVLGATALILPLVIESEALRREYPLMFVIMLGALVLIMDGSLDRIDGFILMLGLVALLFGIVNLALKKNRKDPLEKEISQEIPRISTRWALLWTAGGLLILLISSRGLVWGASNIATAMGVSDLVIGLTIVAIGTSLPELAASLMGALKKEPDLAIGNIIGSNMFNLLAVMGIPGIVAPHVLEASVLNRDYPVMIGLSVALFVMAYGFKGPGRVSRLEGALLLMAFMVYMGMIYLSSVK